MLHTEPGRARPAKLLAVRGMLRTPVMLGEQCGAHAVRLIPPLEVASSLLSAVEGGSNRVAYTHTARRSNYPS